MGGRFVEWCLSNVCLTALNCSLRECPCMRYCCTITVASFPPYAGLRCALMRARRFACVSAPGFLLFFSVVGSWLAVLVLTSLVRASVLARYARGALQSRAWWPFLKQRKHPLLRRASIFLSDHLRFLSSSSVSAMKEPNWITLSF
jgi:hypothetical protein